MEATNCKARSFFCNKNQSTDRELVSQSHGRDSRLMHWTTCRICHLQDLQTQSPSHALALISVPVLVSPHRPRPAPQSD